jgi:hypothetical protein
MLKSTYGSVIIGKDTILYHTTDEEFSYKPDKKLLYTIFHPSEWIGYDSEYIVRILLKRDIEVLFFINGFRKHYILSNQGEKKSTAFLEKIVKENLDGWLASIENRSHVEVAILNDPTIFEVLSFESLRKNWRNGHCLVGIPECKNWGTIYPISSQKIPVVLHLNEKYKRLIEEYIQYGLESKYPFEYAFQVILENAHKKYIINNINHAI